MNPLQWLIRRFLERDPAAIEAALPADLPTDIPQGKKKDSAYNASQFQPISREEILEQGRGLRPFVDPWFGRRDLIPAADDPRTQLIDRGMVSQGILAPEELREIHEVGAEMDRVRPTTVSIEHRAKRQGEAAVEADRAERARIKADKKAEAERTRQARAEAIADRKANDIIYLGRGVSERLHDRQSNAQALETAGLPILSTPAELAEALALSIPRLRWLAFHNEAATRVHYVQFEVPKRSGGTRILKAPHRTLAQAQRWIFREIVSRLPVEAAAQGFLPGRSILTNARVHQNQSMVLNMDLEAFFPSITFPRVRKVFERVGYSPAVATILALLCTEPPRRAVQYDGQVYQVATGPRGLPQGACTSPGLSNQVARRLDRRLAGLARSLELNYTRYADDLTFSGDLKRVEIGRLMASIRHIAQAEGFLVNESKSRVLGRNAAQKVTGLVVNDRPGVPRAEVRRLRAILHRARFEGLDRQNRAGHPDFLAWLRGKIAYVAMARPELGATLKAELNRLLADG